MTIEACEPCLSRAALIGSLAGRIELAATGRPSSQARRLLALTDGALIAALGASDCADGLLGAATAAVAPLRSRLLRCGGWALCRHASGYPEPLEHLGDERPAVLFGLGGRSLLGALDPAVTIVGSRRSSAYGREVAHELGLLVASAGVPVISGMAYGIDGAAHRGALAADEATVAVLGGGVDVPYPVGHRRLHAEIAARGVVLSEMPPGLRPYRWSFPARNRIMAALAKMTVVVEAAERSGSLITVDMAQELGRDVGAVPGPITSRLAGATNELLASGATVIRGAEDVLAALLGPGAAAARTTGPALDGDLRDALRAVESGARTPDAVAEVAALEAGAAAGALARLELLGYVRADPGGRFTRTALAASRGKR